MDLCPYGITNYSKSAGTSKSLILSGKCPYIFSLYKMEGLLVGMLRLIIHLAQRLPYTPSPPHPISSPPSRPRGPPPDSEPAFTTITTPLPGHREVESWDAAAQLWNGPWKT